MYDTCFFFLHLLCACHFPLSSPVLAPLRSFHLGFFRPTPSFVSIPLYSYDTSRPSTCPGTTCTAHTYTASRIRDSPARSLLNFLEPAGPARQFRRRLLHHLTMHARFAASVPRYLCLSPISSRLHITSTPLPSYSARAAVREVVYNATHLLGWNGSYMDT